MGKVTEVRSADIATATGLAWRDFFRLGMMNKGLTDGRTGMLPQDSLHIGCRSVEGNSHLSCADPKCAVLCRAGAQMESLSAKPMALNSAEALLIVS